MAIAQERDSEVRAAFWSGALKVRRPRFAPRPAAHLSQPLLQRVAWRVDVVTGSKHSAELNEPVAVLELETERVSGAERRPPLARVPWPPCGLAH